MPGPLIKARVGDKLRVHFKNLDTAFNRSHSMHFHGVDYKPSSDGAYLPGFSGRDADVKPGQTWTYKLTAGQDSVGAWPYHDHGPAMHEPRSRAACSGCSRSSASASARPTASTSSSSRRWASSRRSTAARSSATRRCSSSRVGDLVQWDVMAMGSEHHTFHVHGHRWRDRDGVRRRHVTVGPAESFRVRWREDATPAPGSTTATWRRTWRPG